MGSTSAPQPSATIWNAGLAAFTSSLGLAWWMRIDPSRPTGVEAALLALKIPAVCNRHEHREVVNARPQIRQVGLVFVPVAPSACFPGRYLERLTVPTDHD